MTAAQELHIIWVLGDQEIKRGSDARRVSADEF